MVLLTMCREARGPGGGLGMGKKLPSGQEFKEKPLSLSGPQFPHLENGSISPCLAEL